MYRVEVEEHVDEEEEEEGDRVKQQDVRDVRHSGTGEELHLLLGRAHEKETRRIEELCNC